MKKVIAITGASGFIGRGIVTELFNAGHEIICLTRHTRDKAENPSCRWEQISDYTNADEIAAAIAGADLVIHLADDPNRTGGKRDQQGVKTATALTTAMRTAGVKGLLLVSSVYARLDAEGHPSAYGAHKRAIEDTVRAAKDIHTIILRLPPVYGPGGRGGMAMLTRLIQRGLPVPVGEAHAPRAYLALSNLSDLIRVIVGPPLRLWARNKGIYEPSDQQMISTRSLATALGKAMLTTPKIVSMPQGLLMFLGRVLGKQDAIAAAFTPLVIHPDPALKKAFGWTPPQSIPTTLEFLSHKN